VDQHYGGIAGIHIKNSSELVLISYPKILCNLNLKRHSMSISQAFYVKICATSTFIVICLTSSASARTSLS